MPATSAYPPREGFFDEMFDLSSDPRPGCDRVVGELFSLSLAQLVEMRRRADAMFLRQGVTFNVYGSEEKTERIFPFDPIPRVIDAATWTGLEKGLVQRVRALNAFVAARTALAKSLSGPEAQRVRSLVKPTVVPWSVNQVYWRARPFFDAAMSSVSSL